MNAHCTATLTVKRHEDGRVSMDICDTHYSHTLLLKHLRISKFQRNEIAQKLCKGIPVDRVLDDIRDNIVLDYKRGDIATRRDVYNIERAFSIGTIE